MKLNLPKIIRPIALTDFAPELTRDDGTPAVVQAWINPPQPLLARHTELRTRGAAAIALAKTDADAAKAEIEAVAGGLHALYAELWSQHADTDTHWTAAEVAEVANSEANPALFGWLAARTIALINDYRSGLRKN